MTRFSLDTLREHLEYFDGEILRLEEARDDLMTKKPWQDADLSIRLATIDHDLRRAKSFHGGTLAAILEHQVQT